MRRRKSIWLVDDLRDSARLTCAVRSSWFVLREGKVSQALGTAIPLRAEHERDGTITSVSIKLVERVGPSQWCASTAADLVPGDRLRFGDQSNRVCFLGTLSASVATDHAGRAILEFEFYGSALDEMISALTDSEATA